MKKTSKKLQLSCEVLLGLDPRTCDAVGKAWGGDGGGPQPPPPTAPGAKTCGAS